MYEAQKKCGLIVDYVGVFDNYANSLRFDEESVKTVITNIKEIKEHIPGWLQDCLDFFPGIDRTIGGFQGLQNAQEKLKDENVKTPETPIVVENVVNDIDTQVVGIVRRFSNAFKTVTGQNEVLKMLRTILWLKYKIKDNEVFEKAYKYVEMYYTPDNGGPSFQAREVNIKVYSQLVADLLGDPEKD